MFRWNLGNGKSVNFWHDAWLEGSPILAPVAKSDLNEENRNRNVNSVALENGCWDLNYVKHMLPDHIYKIIVVVPPPNDDDIDEGIA